MKNKIEKLDILAFGAHPDDVDACAGGLLAKCVKEGLSVGIIDLTSGDNSETANGKLRISESLTSSKILGVKIRKNLRWPDRDIQATNNNEDKLVRIIRKYKPDIAVIPYWEDRHKAHRDTSNLTERAIQSAKYSKIIPGLKAHKVKIILYYMIHYEFEPNFIFDISNTHDLKMKALFCHKSQMFKKNISGKYTNELLDADFIEAWIARSRWYGYKIGVKYGEAYAMRRPTGINTLKSLTNKYV